MVMHGVVTVIAWYGCMVIVWCGTMQYISKLWYDMIHNMMVLYYAQWYVMYR